MEKVPYALKIETSQSCLTLSARYGEVGRGRVWGIGTQDFIGVKVWNNELNESFLFGIILGLRTYFLEPLLLNTIITISHVCKSLWIIDWVFTVMQVKKLR